MLLLLGGGYIYIKSFNQDIAKILFPNIAVCDTANIDTAPLETSIQHLTKQVQSLEEKVDSTKGFIEAAMITTKKDNTSDTSNNNTNNNVVDQKQGTGNTTTGSIESTGNEISHEGTSQTGDIE